MKKVLALVLAVVLAFGMTTVAFAADKKAGKVGEIAFGNVYTFDGDTRDSGVVDTKNLKADTEYFIELITKVYDDNKTTLTEEAATKLSQLSEYKVRTSIDTGAAYIAVKPAFVIKGKTGAKKAYISFKTADKFNKEAEEYEMSVRVFGSENYAPVSYDACAPFEIDGEIGYGDATDVKTYTMIDGNPIANFDDVDGDVEIEFKNDVVFKVNAKGQKELFLRMTDEDEALEDKYPEASLDIVYFDGNNKTFRRSGELTIPADMIEGKEGKLVAPFIYENNNGKLSVCKDAKYDSDKEAFIIKTNKLGNYVISDKELKVEDAKEDGKTDDKDGAEKNPDTGANDFVGLAVALAVVSVAGIAVAKRK